MKKTLFFLVALFFGLNGANAKIYHALSMHGQPKYDKGFSHFSYLNPNAPKKGEIKLAGFNGFDSLNPFIMKGITPRALGLIYDSLTVSSKDEPFSEYGLIAKTMELPEDRSFIAFNLRKGAKFHDGEKITADDVVFTFNILKQKGSPFYKIYYADIKEAKKINDYKVKFVFKNNKNRELPLIIGQMPVLPKHYWQDKDFSKTTLTPPLGSGAYKISKLKAGHFIEYERVKDYWAKDLNVNKGLYNFDKIRVDFYRDTTVAVQAFASGAFDVRYENEAKKWATAYNFDARKEGKVKLEKFYHKMPSGMQGFAFNIRREKFKDRKVRQAIGYAFDFEWVNKNLFYGQYKRTRSYFDNSYLASTGLPSKEELTLLEAFRDDIPQEVFEKEYQPPKTDGTGNIRGNLRKAVRLLKEAGYEFEGKKMVNKNTNKPLEFEILLNASGGSTWERVTLPFIKNLEKIGITAKIRSLDASIYKNRIDSFDFDMYVGLWGQSLSPGNEQSEYWQSKNASRTGSRNTVGIKNKAVDFLVDKIIQAQTRKELITATKALDRVLLFNHYVIPHWHIPYARVAFWDKFGMVEKTPMQGYELFSWWYKGDISKDKK